MKIISFLITLLLPFIVFIKPVRSDENTKDDVYRIGVILPLSGQGASLGNYLRKGVELAYNNLPAEKKNKIQIFLEDDQYQSSKAISALGKLRAAKNIHAVFVMGSGIGNAVVPITEREKLLLVAIGASDLNIVKNKKFAFLHWVTPEVEAEVMAAEIKRRDYKRISIISTEHEGAIAVLNSILEALKKEKLDGRIVLQETYLIDNTDFKTFISKAKARKADSTLVLLFPGALASFAKQARDLDLGAELAGVELFEDEDEVKASDGALIGQWYVNADAAAGDFLALYQKTYKEYPGWSASNAYDALNLLADAVAKHGTDNRKIADYLNTVKDYQGATGNYSATGDHRFDLPATVKIVTRNGFEKLHKEAGN